MVHLNINEQTILLTIAGLILMFAYNLYKTAKLAAFALFAAALMVVGYLIWSVL